MRVLITGVAGFIGSNLATLLRQHGIAVDGVDNFSHGFRRNLAPFRRDSGFRLVEADCRDARAMRPLVKRADVVVHLAAYKIPRYGGRYEMLLVNLDASRLIMEETANHGSGHIVIASTSDAFGKNPNVPFAETSDSILGPSRVARWAYAVSKICDEHMAWGLWEEGRLQPTLLRFFGAYGPRENRTWWGGPQAVFIERALRGQTLELHGTGLQTRTFCYIDDLVSGIHSAIMKPEARGQLFNLGGDREITIRDLAKLAWKQAADRGVRPRLSVIPYKSFRGNYEDVMRRVPDLTTAGRVLGYRPLVTLEEGLKRTVAWHRKFL